MSEAAPDDAPSVDVRATSDEETQSLVEDLVAELADHAFERERVLAKLDIRGAARARRIGRELTLLLRGLAFATGRSELFDSLGQLLEEAHAALEGEGTTPPSTHSAPPASGERPTPPDDLVLDERPTSHGLPQLWGDDAGPQEETIARKVSWARSGNRILGK